MSDPKPPTLQERARTLSRDYGSAWPHRLPLRETLAELADALDRAEERIADLEEREVVEAAHVHRASPSHEEGAWCSMGNSPCGKFLPIYTFSEGDTRCYLIDGRGVPVACYECRTVQGDVRLYPPVPVTLPHEHYSFYVRALDQSTSEEPR